MRPVTVRPVRVTRTPSRMRAHFFAPAFKNKTHTESNDTPELTLVRSAPAMTSAQKGKAA